MEFGQNFGREFTNVVTTVVVAVAPIFGHCLIIVVIVGTIDQV